MIEVGPVQIGIARAEEGKSLFSLEVVQAGINGNAIHPGMQCGISSKLRGIPINADEYILGDFLGVLIVLGIAESGIVDLVANSIIKPLKGCPIAVGNSPNDVIQ